VVLSSATYHNNKDIRTLAQLVKGRINIIAKSKTKQIMSEGDIYIGCRTVLIPAGSSYLQNLKNYRLSSNNWLSEKHV
jgi:hypothetical protein